MKNLYCQTDAPVTPIQHFSYLPFGELQIEQKSCTWGSRYTFSSKEKDTESGYSYFGARYYNSDLSIWLSVDPMAEKRPWESPYSYCGNNPVVRVDQNGMIWEDEVDQKKANDLISQATTNRDAKQKSLDNLRSETKLSNSQKERVSNLEKEINYLDEGIANLTEMGNTKDATYHFKELSGGEGGVKKRDDGVFDIEHTNNAMAWHESVHIGDSKSNLSTWGFSANGYLGTKSDEAFNKAETKAYRSQFSFDNKSLKYNNGTFVSKLGEIKQWMEINNIMKK